MDLEAQTDHPAPQRLAPTETLIFGGAIVASLIFYYITKLPLHGHVAKRSRTSVRELKYTEDIPLLSPESTSIDRDVTSSQSADRSSVFTTSSKSTIKVYKDTVEFFTEENISLKNQGTPLQPTYSRRHHFYHRIVNHLTHIWHKMTSTQRTSRISKPLTFSSQRMSKDVAEKISRDCKKEVWAKGREIVVNEETNTISVFTTGKPGHEDATGIIPLTYQGVCVIPHPFANIKSAICPAELNVPTEQVPHGLSDDQLRRFHDYFHGIMSLDYFLDRQMVIKLPIDLYRAAIVKVGGAIFTAWSCTVLLLYSSSPELKDDIKTRPPMDPSESCAPGSSIFNLDHCFSTLGVFLKPTPRTSEREIEVENFTVSAHSFTAKKSLDLGFHKSFLLLIPLIMNLAYAVIYHGILPFWFFQQYLFVRVSIAVMHIIWKFFGYFLKLHSLKGKIKIKMGITTLGLVFIYIVPALGRVMICGIVEATAFNYFNDLAWLYHSLSAENRNFLDTLFNIISNYGPLLVEIYLTRWLFKKLRMIIEGYVSPTRSIRPSQMANKWMTVTFSNGQGMFGSVTFPYLSCFFWAFLCRSLIYYGYLNIAEDSIRRAGSLFLSWDLIVFGWSFDFPWTYKLVGGSVLTESRGLIGRVIASFESLPSLTSPQVWTNDLAVAQFNKPVVLTSHCAIEWDDSVLPVSTKLYLLGRKTNGHFDPGDTSDVIQGPVQGIVGGFHYIMNLITHTQTTEYETALLWRCSDLTIVGDSGSLLVRITHAGDGQYTVHGVGFQSHELPINPTGTKPQLYWKLAFRPPIELTTKYWALAPRDMVDLLAKKAYTHCETSQSDDEPKIGQFVDDSISVERANRDTVDRLIAFEEKVKRWKEQAAQAPASGTTDEDFERRVNEEVQRQVNEEVQRRVNEEVQRRMSLEPALQPGTQLQDRLAEAEREKERVIVEAVRITQEAADSHLSEVVANKDKELADLRSSKGEKARHQDIATS